MSGLLNFPAGAMSTGTLISGIYVSHPEQCTIDVDTLRRIRILLRCIQQPVVAYDNDVLTMVQSAVGYCGEKAAEVEALLPRHGLLEDDE